MPFMLPKEFKTQAELATQTREILEWVQRTGQPLGVTVHGKTAAILLEVSQYEYLLHLLNLSRLLNESEAEIRAGRARPLDEVMKDLLREKPVRGRSRAKRQARPAKHQ